MQVIKSGQPNRAIESEVEYRLWFSGSAECGQIFGLHIMLMYFWNGKNSNECYKTSILAPFLVHSLSFSQMSLVVLCTNVNMPIEMYAAEQVNNDQRNANRIDYYYFFLLFPLHFYRCIIKIHWTIVVVVVIALELQTNYYYVFAVVRWGLYQVVRFFGISVLQFITSSRGTWRVPWFISYTLLFPIIMNLLLVAVAVSTQTTLAHMSM